MTIPAPEVDAAAIAAAKAKIGPGAQAVLGAVRDLAQRAVTLLSAPAALRASARQQTEILNSDAVTAQLRARPIAVLVDPADPPGEPDGGMGRAEEMGRCVGLISRRAPRGPGRGGRCRGCRWSG